MAILDRTLKQVWIGVYHMNRSDCRRTDRPDCRRTDRPDCRRADRPDCRRTDALIVTDLSIEVCRGQDFTLDYRIEDGHQSV